mgnify:FL=1
MYVKKMYNLGKHKEIIEVHNFYPGNYGAPGKSREKKEKASSEVIKKQNHANRVRKIQRLILGNFKAGDWHIVLKYKKELRPEDFKEAKDQLSNFFKKMRLDLKKHGISFKYIGVTEMGKKGNALHHHIIVENITDPVNMLQLIRKYWEYGHIALTDLYEEGAYQRLAEYIVKAETKDPEGKSSYKRSRGNLIEPQAESKIMLRKSWPKEPRPKKGYYIIADSVIQGENPVTGYPYQRYMMQKLPSTGAVGREETKWKQNVESIFT